MGQDVGVSLSSLAAAFRRVATPGQRRELLPYSRFALRHPTVAFSALVDGLLFSRPGAGSPPRALAWPPPQTASALRVGKEGRLPLRTPPGGNETVSALPLATREWALAEGPPWTGVFSDPEDRFAAHRFGWVLPVLASHGRRAVPRLAELALVWQRDHRPDEGAPGWDSYSVAERIVYWCYLLAATEDASIEAALVEAIGGHARFLRDRLEFRGESTNNHLLNDGRALYHAGVVSQEPALRGLGRHLVDYGASHMFVAGFLREGSSHYHLLLCRTFAELWTLARTVGDDEWADRLKGYVDDMAKAARFFDAPGGPRLFGDVSPDFEPVFLSGLARVADEGALEDSVPEPQWRGLLDGLEELLDGGAATSSRAAEAGYYRASEGDWHCAAFVNPLGHVPAWSHAHADLGSFVLDWRKMPLLVDGGRSTYRPSPLGDYGRSVRSHNAVSIDGHEPCLAHGLNGVLPLLGRAYYDRPPRVELLSSEGSARLHLAHDGFGRLGDGVSHAREVVLDGERCQVTDSIAGRGRRTIETFFHFHPAVTVSLDEPTVASCQLPDGARLRLRLPDVAGCRLARGQTEPRPAGWYAGRYGDATPCWTLICEARAPLPTQQRYELAPV